MNFHPDFQHVDNLRPVSSREGGLGGFSPLKLADFVNEKA